MYIICRNIIFDIPLQQLYPIVCRAVGILYYALNALWIVSFPWQQGSWGQRRAHLGTTWPRWTPCWPREPCYVKKCLCKKCFNLNSLRPRLNRRPSADDIFKCIFLNENEWILPRISLKFVPEVWINNIPALVQIMAWRRPGDKPLSEPMMVSLLTHICVTRPQWVNGIHWSNWHMIS